MSYAPTRRTSLMTRLKSADIPMEAGHPGGHPVGRMNGANHGSLLVGPVVAHDADTSDRKKHHGSAKFPAGRRPGFPRPRSHPLPAAMRPAPG